MTDLQALFSAHSPRSDYLSSLCTHSYCSFLSVAVLLPSPEHRVMPFAHAHEPYEFLIPLTPMPVMMHGDNVYFGRVGFVYPVQSGSRHAQAVELCDVSNCSIVVDKAYFEQRLEEKGLSGTRFERIFPASDNLNTYLQLFQAEFFKGDHADRIDLAHLGALIVSTLIEDGCRPPVYGNPPDELSVMDEIEAYINQHFCEKITLDALAERSSFTKSHFMALFKRHCGEAPYARITRLRLAKAKVLLRSTDYPVSKVSALCGFPSSNAFANVFRKDTGMTPSEFRHK